MNYIHETLQQLEENDRWEKRIATLSLDEDILLEGKNLQKTIDIYLPKFRAITSKSGISDEANLSQIKSLIALDPTYKEGSNFTGDYGTWILDRFIKYFKEGNIGDFYKTKLTPLLTNFINVKQSLPNKDIGAYKTIEDLKNAVDNAILSDRQKERRLRNSKDYHIVYQDNDWTVYVPDTFAGSCTLGKGTSWCTAYSGNNEYYYNYTEQGPLYIIINNHNKSEKYQFHYPSQQFMDKEDEEIDRYAIFGQNEGLHKFFIKQGLEIDPSKPFIYDGENRIPKNVVNVIVSDSVEYIDEDAFYDCVSLKSVIISNSVKEIGYHAFHVCKSLQSITIPNSVKEIDGYAFSGCSSLQSIIIPNSIKKVSVGVFCGCSSLQSIAIPNSVEKIGKLAFSWCTSLKLITIPSSVEEIGDYAFNACKSLESITIPSSVKKIGDRIFHTWISLQYVTVKKDSIAHIYMAKNYPEIKLIFKDV